MILAILAATAMQPMTVRELTLHCAAPSADRVCERVVEASWLGTQLADIKTSQLRHTRPLICAPQDETAEVLVPRIMAWLAADLAMYPKDADGPATPFVAGMMYVFYACPDSPLKK